MTHRYEHRCWYCGSKNMETDDRGVKCRDCGATWSTVPRPRDSGITTHRDYGLAPKGTGTITSASPSDVVKHRAAKARSDTKDKASPKVPSGHTKKRS